MLSILHSALDLVMLMSYDYHEVNRTSINAPLNRESNQNPYTETVAENVERVLAQGCRPEKVIMVMIFLIPFLFYNVKKFIFNFTTPSFFLKIKFLNGAK